MLKNLLKKQHKTDSKSMYSYFHVDIKEDVSINECIQILIKNLHNIHVPFSIIIKNEETTSLHDNYILRQNIHIFKNSEVTYFISISDNKFHILQQKIVESKSRELHFIVNRRDNQFKIIKHIPKHRKQYPMKSYELYTYDNILPYTKAFDLINDLLANLRKNERICEILDFEHIYYCLKEDENYGKYMNTITDKNSNQKVKTLK